MKLKVYGGNLGGRHRAIGAFPNKREFMAATGIGRDFCDDAANDAEIAKAMTAPGTIFTMPFRKSEPQVWSIYERGRGHRAA